MLGLIVKAVEREGVGPQRYCVGLALALSSHSGDGKKTTAKMVDVRDFAEKMGVEPFVTRSLVEWVALELGVELVEFS